jgi:hypothetical protein
VIFNLKIHVQKSKYIVRKVLHCEEGMREEPNEANDEHFSNEDIVICYSEGNYYIV